MMILSRRVYRKAGQLSLLVIALLAYPLVACPGEVGARGFSLRNQNPFLQIFGLPPFQSAALSANRGLEYTISLDLANHADAGDSAVENFVIDGESYFLTLSLRRRMTTWLQLGADLPLVAHAKGFMDGSIESWHDAFGMSNSKRLGPDNRLRFLYERDGAALYELSSPASGIGDIQLNAAVPVREATDNDGRAVTVRAALKLPTGDENELLGSGAADFSIGLYASDARTLLKRDLGLSGFAGVLLLGEGDVLPALQRSTVPFGGVAATWQATERFAISTQLYVQGAYFDSALEGLGGNSVQLTVGGDYHLQRSGLTLKFAVVEDVSANATTDFALHFSVHGGSR